MIIVKFTRKRVSRLRNTIETVLINFPLLQIELRDAVHSKLLTAQHSITVDFMVLVYLWKSLLKHHFNDMSK